MWSWEGFGEFQEQEEGQSGVSEDRGGRKVLSGEAGPGRAGLHRQSCLLWKVSGWL